MTASPHFQMGIDRFPCGGYRGSPWFPPVPLDRTGEVTKEVAELFQSLLADTLRPRRLGRADHGPNRPHRRLSAFRQAEPLHAAIDRIDGAGDIAVRFEEPDEGTDLAPFPPFNQSH